MHRVNFTKMVASGNDFIVVKNSPRSASYGHQQLARRICDRKFGVGADGMLVLEKTCNADIRMRIFNADGTQAEMCGNGARCVALYLNAKRKTQNAKLNIETKAGIIEAQVHGDNVKIKLTDPKNLKLGLPIRVNKRTLRVNFINTGVPHAVIFSEGLDKIDVFNLGRTIRYHKAFAPAGTNVNFIEVAGTDSLDIRTYERGVEDETLACGTGSVAAALVAGYSLSRAFRQAGIMSYQLFLVHTKSGEILKVYFKQTNSSFHDVWLEGKAKIVYQGEYNV